MAAPMKWGPLSFLLFCMIFISYVKISQTLQNEIKHQGDSDTSIRRNVGQNFPTSDKLDVKNPGKVEVHDMSSKLDVDVENARNAPLTLTAHSDLSQLDLEKMNKISRRTANAAHIAKKNFHHHSDHRPAITVTPAPAWGENIYGNSEHGKFLRYDNEVTFIDPGDTATPFSLKTLDGTFAYPNPDLKDRALLFHAFTRDSGFLNAMWHNGESLKSILMNSPDSVHYIFFSSSTTPQLALEDAKFMKKQLNDTIVRLRFPRMAVQNFLRMHFVTDPLPNLLKTGNWIAYAFYTWTCSDHNCGIDQINITSKDFGKDGAAFQRLDARYDWLPSPVSRLGNKTIKLVYAGYGCREITTNVAGCVALVLNGTCSYYQKVLTMQKMGAKAVLVMASYGLPLEDMQCHGSECDDTLQIPAAMIPYNFKLIMADSPMVRYHNKPCNNFFTGVDRNGKLAEVGWFLYPSFQFFVWQAEWFDYMYGLVRNVTIKPSMLIPVLDHTTMQGKKGAVATVIIPAFTDLQQYGLVQLDMSLDCPGKKDESCPHWDHTVQLYVCCDNTSALCGMELGRWISPFRRRIGRWLTDITPLIPLLASQTVTQCNFTMKTAPWAMAWVPSLRLRLSHIQESKGQAPADILPLFTVGATFDKSYNSHWKPVTMTIPSYAKKVVLVAVITGHGSDNNGCGEFCVTSHHFTVNNKTWSVTFTNAGTPLGCANRVPMGVEPNEHGTWLYGRDGWCDGNEIDPIIFDLTAVAPPNEKVIISYRGTYNNTDPNPTHSPGYITLYSYLTIYKVV